MPIEQTKSNKKSTGGRLKDNRKSRQHAKGSNPIMTTIGEKRAYNQRSMGGVTKERLRSVLKITVTNPKTQKTTVEEVTNVAESNSNPNFVRRNVITKGAVVETKSGKVKVTSRPGQQGSLSGVLIV